MIEWRRMSSVFGALRDAMRGRSGGIFTRNDCYSKFVESSVRKYISAPFFD